MIDMNALINARSTPNFQLRFAQEKYNDLECSLNQRVHCIQIQLKNIQAYNNEDNIYLNQLIQQARTQIQTMIHFYYDTKNRESEKLLAKQTIIQEQAQLNDIVKQYQDRIYQMGCNLYTKQVDISVDHVGKLNEQKPLLNRVKQLSKIKTEVQNIQIFLNKASALKKNVNRLSRNSEILRTNEVVEEKTNKIFLSALTMTNSKQQTQGAQKIVGQNNQQKQKDKIGSMITKQSSQDSSQSNPEVEKFKTKGRRMLILSSQSKLYEQKKICHDPQLIRMESLLSKQKQRQKRMLNQYDRLKEKFTDLCMQNRQLACEYKKIKHKSTIQEDQGIS